MTDLSLGPLKVRLELLPIAVGLWAAAGAAMAASFLIAILVHETAHWAAARVLAPDRPKLTLQLTGGGSYVREIDRARARAAILGAGPIAGAALALSALAIAPLAAGGPLQPFVRELFYVSAVWTAYQLMPFPPLDGGQLLRLVLEPRIKSATTVWRLEWVLGFILAAVLVLVDLHNLTPVVLLTGIALILGRGESGYVRHLDAYSAWKRGDHARVLELIRKLPDYLEANDRRALLELGVFSAMELGDDAALERVALALPAQRPITIRAAQALLDRRHPAGAKLAQRALDALDAGLAQPSKEQLESFADLTFRFALYEARDGRVESALGLLERAIELCFSDLDRLEADGDLRSLRAHPRFTRLKELRTTERRDDESTNGSL